MTGGAAAAAILVALPALLGPPGGPTPAPVIGGNLLVGGGEYALSTQLLGVNVHVVGVQNNTLAALVNSTPFGSYRFSPAGEATDQIHSVTYSQYGMATPSYAETDAQFVTWCRWIHCQATMMVPAEIDNPLEAAATMRYVEQNLSFSPAYWAIGNEPQQWTHFGIPWTDWRPTDDSTVGPVQYAQLVQQYVIAMRTADPSARIIGIESVVGGSLAAGWFKDLAQVDGPNLTAVAYHAYPLGNATGIPGLAQYFRGLTIPSAFPLNYPVTRSILAQACPVCNISVFVDEFNSALGGNYTGYMTSYPEVPYVAATLVAAMNENASRVLFFDLEDLDAQQPYGLTTLGDGTRPVFSLFSVFLDHMALGSVINSTLAYGPGGVYEVLTTNGFSTSLLVVNTNVSDALQFALPPTTLFSLPLQEYMWTPGEAVPTPPVAVRAPAAVGGWLVPPMSLLMLDWDAPWA